MDLCYQFPNRISSVFQILVGNARLNGRRIREKAWPDEENSRREKIAFHRLCFGGFHRGQFTGEFRVPLRR
jgi:hypothetical protein